MKKTKVAILLAVCVGVVMTFSACGKPYSSYNLSDYIKVGNYKGLEVAKYTIKVTDKQINKEIKSRLEAKASTKEVKKGTVKDKDTIVITYEGKINGKTFENGSAQGANLTIGSGQMIDGFESGLIGVKVGATKTLKLKFPSSYSDSNVAGKKVVFTVTVDAKQVKTTPTLNTEFVKSNSKYDTVAEYKDYVKNYLAEKQKEDGIQTQKDYLWNKVLESSTVKTDKKGNEKYPQDEVDRIVKETKDMYTKYAKNYNMKLSAFIKQQMNMDTKTFNKQLKAYAKTQVKEEEVLYYIADKEKIDVSKKEYNAYIKKQLKQYGYTEDSYKEANGETYEKSIGKDNIKKEIYKQKVESLILKDAKVVDKVKS